MSMEFIEYLAGLAPQGETALIVRQRPRLDDSGEVQLHADGAVKATWPAFLPTVDRVKPGQAWYGNTASFIVDRFADGRVSASAACCEFVLVMVLDDIGTKCRQPPLPPTWIMETSPGNYQWGYAFSEQPGKAEFAAAIRAVSAAGFTDPGACNPVRNFRLPGSVNLKPGRGGFVSRLVDWQRNREFTLGEICAAMGVVPGPAEATGPRPIRLADDGADDVAAWLSERGLALSAPNSEGWMGVVCPQADQHTDGNPEGRYLPSGRAFCCLHSHCIDLDSAGFLAWVAEQGGPRHVPGLREELLQRAMQQTIGMLEAPPALAAEAAAVVAEVDRREAGRVEKADWWERWAYLISDDAYFDLHERRQVSRTNFNAIYRHIACRSVHGKAPKIEASICYDEHRQDKGGRILQGVTFAAGESILVSRDGDVYGNRWRDGRRPGVPGDVSRWLAHAERMLPDHAEREHVLDMMAFKLQYPRIKVNHGILHAGRPGSGKDTLWAPFFWSIGTQNVKLVRNEEVTSQWGYAYEAEVLVLNELRQAEAKDRRALENTLKPLLAAPPDTIPIQRKGLHPYDALNRLMVVAFSNERVAISLPSDDRRWFVLWSDVGIMSAHDAAAMWAWYDAGGFAAVAAWLHVRDVSHVNPGAAPMMTEAKAIMLSAGLSGMESWLVEQMTHKLGRFGRGVVAGPWQGFCEDLQLSAPLGTKVVVPALLHAFREAGWIDMGRVYSAELPTKRHAFSAPDWTGSKSDARRIAEMPPASAADIIARVRGY
jgi:hypothetical protein